ncbi:ATP-binding cassette domain-containing protein [Pandoraea sp. XJJ-1]|uniref:ABC transporter ATP-binding protein n=2 Tax=Pandoraea TaxID=93217 RepID=A0A5E4UCR8_9BURK|nr:MULTISPECIES: ATP-binding cassette domain-containing protein [Pandoraea]MBN9116468.1 ATP-binding cassette domain-containing protein [Pandoraea sp.]MDN4574027.1 ABC transporter ATP-binding protein [Pandoraea cepalis]MDN4580563.1 ABC transporter ATP-binding protein [Pandoraea cepalis]OJY19321.1 MAG: ABC transporter ATP-binding protein [Pandoraea sp. 64-18]WAL83925.1 ATP-binding cassette domain-containing protein [Pandoraea sp. XJJ-1]
MSSELLQLVGVHKRFGAQVVLNDVNFAVVPGEIVGLVGPNGSGKTTTINVISGLLQADEGAIDFLGQTINRMPMHRRVHLGINRTFQVPKVFRDMTVHENVEVAARSVRLDPREIGPILEDIGLASVASRVAGSLTVNQQKLLDLGRALATRPQLLLVDEIGAGLNPAELNVIAELLQRLSARGIAMIVVEHLLDFLNRITERVIVLGAGRMLFEGPLASAARDPEVIAAFIGAA